MFIAACYSQHRIEGVDADGGAHADAGSDADAIDVDADQMDAVPDPCTIPGYAFDALLQAQITPECIGIGPEPRSWVFSPELGGTCITWHCPCPRPDCAPEDLPYYDCIYDREAGRRPADFPQDYCRFDSRQDCMCQCLSICSD
jgi:hypothetical protein